MIAELEGLKAELKEVESKLEDKFLPPDQQQWYEAMQSRLKREIAKREGKPRPGEPNFGT